MPLTAGTTLWQASLEPEQRKPHARLLQTLDALSLALCSAAIAPLEGEPKGLGEDHIVVHEVARQSWEDRVSLEIKPLGDGRIMIDPYPFDESPLTVNGARAGGRAVYVVAPGAPDSEAVHVSAEVVARGSVVGDHAWRTLAEARAGGVR